MIDDDRRARALSALLGPPTHKSHRWGTHRSRSPDETWRLIEPLLPRFGVTRVADVTGLDRIGIPVWMAVRPNSLSLSVTQGKGLAPVLAKVSAAMEALEIAHGEQTPAGVRLDTWARLSESAEVVDLAGLPPLKRSLFGPQRALLWIESRDLLGGGAPWLPYELIHTDATLPWMLGSGCFLASTNGLASGNTLAEAVLHALCEVVERDAIALWDHAGPARQAATRIDLGSATDPDVREVLARYEAAGIAVMAWDMTSDIGLPVVRAIIFDAEADPELKPLAAAFGAGCHPDPGVALLRALTEAAQSRLTGIAGSRDDLSRARYRSTQHPAAFAFHRKRAQEPGVVALSRLPAWAGETVDADIAHVLDRLAAVGVKQVLAVDLSLPDLPIAVARVIVPGLEGPTESGGYLPGPRVAALRQEAST